MILNNYLILFLYVNIWLYLQKIVKYLLRGKYENK